MKFGMHNPSWVFGSNAYDAFERVKAKAQWAENNGFAWFSVMDHVIQLPWNGPPDEPFMEGWTVLAAIAAVTSRIRLATLVSAVGYRNPALLGKMATTVDVISGGRLTLGIGAGYFEKEYRQYGWDFPEKPAVRIRQVEEAVRLILTMWGENRATFHGKYFRLEDAILEPKPVQKPRPPVMIAGGGEQLTLRVVARLGDMCNVAGPPAEVKRKLEILRAHCDTEGRDYAAIEKTNITGLLLARSDAELAAKRERLGIGPEFIGFASTVAPAMDLAGRYRDAGVDMMITSIAKNDAETMELLASEIMPHL